MVLISPQNGALVGGYTRLVFDTPVQDFDIKVNGLYFHTIKDDKGYVLDLNDLLPATPIELEVIPWINGSAGPSETRTISKPRHDLAGMGATVIRNQSGTVTGTFFKFWLPGVSRVYVRGSFNGWRDENRLNALSESGYWYGYSEDARPGDDYIYFVYVQDGNFDEVSDPAARYTVKTRHNDPDAQDANAVVVDPNAFGWRHDLAFAEQRRDFSRYIIYQLHWGTFLRPDNGSFQFETFTTGATETEKRDSVRRKLQYIVGLGFTAVELLPIHEANGPFNAGYDPSFFFAVETAYGQPDDLRMLVDEAHGLGLAVIFDAVINHLTNDDTHSSFSQEFIKGWYIKENAPWSNHNQWGGDDWGADPDYDRPEIRNLLTDCIRLYFDEYHVDGVRFDATTTIPADALKSIIGSLRQAYNDEGKHLIAEHLTNDPFPYIIGEIGFGAAWYKPAFDGCVHGVLGQPGKGNLQTLRQVFETAYEGRPASAIKYLLGSHDEVWASHGGTAALARFGGSGNFYARSKLRLAWALNVTLLGQPMLFMGSEGMTDISWHNYYGYNGNNEHTPGAGLNWEPAEGSEAYRFQKLIKDINRLRLEIEALRTSASECELVHTDEGNGILAYKRWDHFGGVLLIVINCSDNQWEQREYRLDSGTPLSTWREIFNSQDEAYGGWTGSGNADPSFRPLADAAGKLQGINVPKWSLLILKQQL